MAAKPSVDPKWSTSQDPVNIIEPTPALKTSGVISGGVWGREHLNWMFNSVGQWIDWIRSYAMDKDNNLSDLVDKGVSRTNLDVYSKSQSDALGTTGNAATATLAAKATILETARTIDITGDITAVAELFDGSSDISIAVTLPDASTTVKGVVEGATQAEMAAGSGGKFPDCATIKADSLPITIWTGSDTSVSHAEILSSSGFVVVNGNYNVKIAADGKNIVSAITVTGVTSSDWFAGTAYPSYVGGVFKHNYAFYDALNDSFGAVKVGVSTISNFSILEITYTPL